MLQSLIKKIKSEKSEAQSSKHSTGSKGENALGTSTTIAKAQYYQQIGPYFQIESDIKRIRYYSFSSGPSLYASILACPISTFNLLPYAKRKVKQIDLTKDPSPPYLDSLRPILQKELPTFNHLLVNVYPAGLGIMPHFDGPLYRPKVVVLSLGGPAVINFTDSYKNINKTARVLLQDQSIHIFEEEAYVKYLHGIEDFSIDSVFLKVDFPEGQKPIIVRSSITNFPLTRLYAVAIEKLTHWKDHESLEEMDLSKQTNTNSCLMTIKQNEEYNFKIQIVRQERISLTIRQRINSDPSHT